MVYFRAQGYHCRSKLIEDDNIRDHRCQQPEEAGEEFHSELEWLSTDASEDNKKGSVGGRERVFPGSASEYFAPTGISDGWPVAINFICPSRGGLAPDVECCYGDVRASLVRPGVSVVQEECLEEYSGKDRHS